MFDIQTSPAERHFSPEPASGWPPGRAEPGRGGRWERGGEICATEAEITPVAFHMPRTGPVPPTGQVPDWFVGNAGQGSRFKQTERVGMEAASISHRAGLM